MDTLFNHYPLKISIKLLLLQLFTDLSEMYTWSLTCLFKVISIVHKKSYGESIHDQRNHRINHIINKYRFTQMKKENKTKPSNKQ